MADAFARAGHRVEIFIPGWRKSVKSSQFKGKYSVKGDFKIHYLPYVSLRGKCKAASFSAIVFMKSLVWDRQTFIITRNERVAYLLTLQARKVIYENHTFYYSSGATTLKYRSRVARLMRNKNVHMITISHRLKELWANYGIDKSKISVIHDGVTIEDYRNLQNLSKDDVRTKLNLPYGKRIVCYTGTLRIERGIDFILEASKLYKDYIFVLVGGSQREIDATKSHFNPSSNVIFTGYVDN
ncbi:MAG: glycosyltransferase family 4 protein, partial [Candidatus Omnitrophota bacterium]